jgi:putative transposase
MVNYTLWANISALAALKKKGIKVGHLRFRGPGWYKTLNYNQSGFKLDPDGSILYLSKIGDMKINLRRAIEGTIKAVVIKRSGKQWYAVFQVDQEPEVPEVPDPAVRSVGIDVGLRSFVVDTEGNVLENPRFAESSSQKVRSVQRKISRTKKGSNNRRKLRDTLDKVHDKITNQRSDFLHKLSRRYVDNFDVICVENLDVKELGEQGNNKGLHRGIHDASWARFRFMLSYKAECAGKKLIKVDPRNTTQRCSSCGSIVKKELSDRVHQCHYCGFSSDRDYNAARNILLSGREQPVAPIEPKPLHHVSVMQVLAMKWEALPFRVG